MALLCVFYCLPVSAVESVKPCAVAGGESNCQQSEMTFWELYDLVQIRRALGAPSAEQETALHLKIALPLATFFTTLLVAPLALTVGRLGPTFGTACALSLVFIWYLLFAIFKPLGAQSVVAPWLAAWIQNLLFALAGLGVWFWLRRDRFVSLFSM